MCAITKVIIIYTSSPKVNISQKVLGGANLVVRQFPLLTAQHGCNGYTRVCDKVLDRVLSIHRPLSRMRWLGCSERAGGPLPFPAPSIRSVRSRLPKIQLGDLGSAVTCKLPQRGLALPAGSGAEPQPTNDLVHFSLKI